MLAAHTYEVDFRAVVAKRASQSIHEVVARSEKNPRRKAALESMRKTVSSMLEDSEGAKSLTSLRLAKGWSQTTLAARLGVTQPYVAKIEKGQEDMRMSTVMKLAEAFGVSPNEIFEAARTYVAKVE